MGKKDPKKGKDTKLLTKDELELRDLKLDLRTVDSMFEKWYREEETLSGVLNMKLITQRN